MSTGQQTDTEVAFPSHEVFKTARAERIVLGRDWNSPEEDAHGQTCRRRNSL